MSLAASPPSAMRAWQYTTTKGGIENTIKLVSEVNLPVPRDPSTQHVVQIISTCLNPVDHKPAEAIPTFLLPKPATPGIDFVGRLATPASNSNVKKGQMVFGVVGYSPVAGGALAEYAVSPKDGAAPLPQGVSPTDAATIGVAGLTAYQTIVPHVKEGNKIFINGGSGGVGVFGIQIAKAIGCQVTTACSTANVELCKSLGADEVIDYKKSNVLDALKSSGNFDHVVDNVGSDYQLYWKAHQYTTKPARFVGVAAEPSLRYVSFAGKVKVWPSFLGGGKRKYESFLAQANIEDLTQIAEWMVEGKVKSVIDQRFPFEEAPDAIRKLKTGRAKGKIMIDVAADADGLL